MIRLLVFVGARTLLIDTCEGESLGPGLDPALGESLRIISTSRDKLKGKFSLAGSPDRTLFESLPPPLEFPEDPPEPPFPLVVEFVEFAFEELFDEELLLEVAFEFSLILLLRAFNADKFDLLLADGLPAEPEIKQIRINFAQINKNGTTLTSIFFSFSIGSLILGLLGLFIFSGSFKMCGNRRCRGLQ